MPIVTQPGGGAALVEVELRALDNISEQVDNISRRFDEFKRKQQETNNTSTEMAKQSTMSWTEFRSMYSTVLDVVRVGQEVWDATAQKYIENALAVDNMARSMGAAPEEASRLKEITDDLGISMSTLKVAMREAIKDGSAPTIETLAKMSDEYLALAPGVDRAQYLTDKFGKSGAEMGKLMEIGADGIREMSAAVDDSLIVTEEGISKAKRFQMAQDNINDAWTSFTYDIAPPLIDALSSVLNYFNDNARVAEILKEKYGDMRYYSLEQTQAAREQAIAEREVAEETRLAADAAGDASGEFETEAEAQKRLADETKLAAEALNDMTNKNKDMLGLITDIQGEMDSYNGKLAELTQKYGENSKEVLQLKEDHENAMKQIALDLFIVKLQADGFTDAEYNAALEAMKSAGVIDQATIDMAKSWDQSAQSAANAVTEADNLTNSVNNIPTEKTITITTVYSSVGNAGQIGGVDNPGMGGYATGTGGWLTVPQGFPNDSYKVGLQSGEKFAVVPSGQSMPDSIDYDKLRNAVATAFASQMEDFSSILTRAVETKFQQSMSR